MRKPIAITMAMTAVLMISLLLVIPAGAQGPGDGVQDLMPETEISTATTTPRFIGARNMHVMAARYDVAHIVVTADIDEAAHEIQSASFPTTTASGTFTLSTDLGETAAITWNAAYTTTASNMATALNDAELYDTSGISVTYDTEEGIFLMERMADEEMGLITVSGNSLLDAESDPVADPVIAVVQEGHVDEGLVFTPQISLDGTNWFSVDDATTMTTDGAGYKKALIPFSYLRVSMVPTGTVTVDVKTVFEASN
jgi:hypothetical protein